MNDELALYTRVYIGLIALTVITVACYGLHLARIPAVALAMGIATVKAYLIGMFFMHLREDRPLVIGIAVTGILAVLILIVGILPDMAWKW